MDKRKAFKFYRSYYDIAMQLDDENRYQFLMALVEMEFTGTHRQLTGMANFAFTSQKHSIEAQIEGYKARMEGATAPPKAGGKPPPMAGAEAQEEEKEKEQEKVKEKAQPEIETFGTHSQTFFTVQAKYASEPPCRIYPDGLKSYCEKHLLGFWFKRDYMAELFWKENTGKMFNEHTHVNNTMLKINNG